jgi:hypothetical protein
MRCAQLKVVLNTFQADHTLTARSQRTHPSCRTKLAPNRLHSRIRQRRNHADRKRNRPFTRVNLACPMRKKDQCYYTNLSPTPVNAETLKPQSPKPAIHDLQTLTKSLTPRWMSRGAPALGVVHPFQHPLLPPPLVTTTSTRHGSRSLGA